MGIELTPGSWLGLAAAAGLAGVDAASWPQAMVSRPLVAATVGGWLLGDPAAGFLVGVLLELLTLRQLPFGGARSPDLGPASVVAGAAYAGVGTAGDPAALLAAALVGCGLGWVGEVTVGWLRRLSGRALRDTGELARRPAILERRQRLLAAGDLVRGGALGAAFVVPGTVAVRLLAGGTAGPAVGAVTAAALGAAAGSGARALGSGDRGLVLVLLGAAAGFAAGGWLAP
jgi:PTS system mannose-specific IIC component